MPEGTRDERGPGAGAPPDAPRARCVVLHPEGRPPREGLLAALGRHGLDVVVSSSPHLAFAEVCRAGVRGQAVRRVLLLTEPERMVGTDRLALALERYCPGAVCWVYQPGANPPVRGYVLKGAVGGVVSPSPEPVRLAVEPSKPAPARRAGSPMLRLIEAPDGPPAASEESEPSRILTGEELTMLLAEGGKDGRP